MSDAGEIEIFQRWLQSKLVATQHIEDPIERDRRRSHIESAISEAIYFRESLEKLESLESRRGTRRTWPEERSSSPPAAPHRA